jgi:cytidine deaminase
MEKPFMNPEQKKLLLSAQAAAQTAYAPYSKFRVGAAVLTEKGVFSGSNIENAASNLGICAERVAMANAKMARCKKIIGIAVNCVDATPGSNGKIKKAAAVPCGGCRQWIAELAPDAWIVTNASGEVYSLDQLLPNPFSLTASKD